MKVVCTYCDAALGNVTNVARSGRPMKDVRGFLEIDGRRVSLRLRARPLAGAVEVTLEEADAE